MTVVTEQGSKGEQLSFAEMGEKSYQTITGIANNLLATPEFMDALGKAFFRRQWSNHTSHNEIDRVLFERGDFAYLVEWHSTRYEPRLHSFPQTGEDMIVSGLTLTKYDPRVKTDGWLKKIAEAGLSSHFLVDKEGKIDEFTSGRAFLGEDYGEPDSHGHQELDPKNKTEDIIAAIDRLPEVFGDLYPTPLKI